MQFIKRVKYKFEQNREPLLHLNYTRYERNKIGQCSLLMQIISVAGFKQKKRPFQTSFIKYNYCFYDLFH